MNMTTILLLVCAIAVSLAVSRAVIALIDRQVAESRRKCYDIARQMRREWHTYPEEKKRACALWLSRLGLRAPSRTAV